MRLIFVNRFYWPETPATSQLLTDLAEHLAAQGHEVHVITSHPGTPAIPLTATRHRVQISRVRGTRHQQRGALGKACDFFTFYLGALWQLFRLTRRQSIIIALTDPPLFGIGAAWIAGARGARLIHWIQDIYPELAIELTAHRWLRITRPWRNAAWAAADHCVTLGEDMAAVIAAAGVPQTAISVIPNWAPVGLAPAPATALAALREEWGLGQAMVVAYSGNFGRVHDLASVIALATTLRDEPEIAFVFIGSGAQHSALEAEARRRGLTRVTFLPAQSRARLGAALGVGDVHLVTLRRGCEHLVFPSKLYGICAVARPLIFIGPQDCEIAGLINQHGFGWSVDPAEPARLVALIRSLATDASLRAAGGTAAARFHAQHTFADAASQWEARLRSLGAHPSTTPFTSPPLQP